MAITRAMEGHDARDGTIPPVSARPGGLFRALYLRLPHSVRAGLSAEQVEALRVAAAELGASHHAIDLRLVLPTPAGRVYLALIGGHDRRGGKGGTGLRAGNAASRLLLLGSAAALGLSVVALAVG